MKFLSLHHQHEENYMQVFNELLNVYVPFCHLLYTMCIKKRHHHFKET